jgi:hypothetical protein
MLQLGAENPFQSPESSAALPAIMLSRRDLNKGRVLDLFALPGENEVIWLIHRYFATVGLVLPFIHKETFLNKYLQARKDNFVNVERSWLCLLNTIFATVKNSSQATLFHLGPVEEAEMYCQRAVGLIDQKMTFGANIEVGKCKFGLKLYFILILTSRQFRCLFYSAHIYNQLRDPLIPGPCIVTQSKPASKSDSIVLRLPQVCPSISVRSGSEHGLQSSVMIGKKYQGFLAYCSLLIVLT